MPVFDVISDELSDELPDFEDDELDDDDDFTEGVGFFDNDVGGCEVTDPKKLLV
jgi:hypothetical protein